MSQPLFTYAKPQVRERLRWLSLEASFVLCDVIMWCLSKGITPVISDAVTTLDEDEKLNRQSSTHREGRAFDISTNGWTQDMISECVRVYSFKYRYLAAIVGTGEEKLVYWHDAGTGPHLHFQVNSRYKVNYLASDLS